MQKRKIVQRNGNGPRVKLDLLHKERKGKFVYEWIIKLLLFNKKKVLTQP